MVKTRKAIRINSGIKETDFKGVKVNQFIKSVEHVSLSYYKTYMSYELNHTTNKLNSSATRLLNHFLLIGNKSNEVHFDMPKRESYLNDMFINKKADSLSSLNRALKKLSDSDLITSIRRSYFMINPTHYLKDSEVKREELIRCYHNLKLGIK